MVSVQPAMITYYMEHVAMLMQVALYDIDTSRGNPLWQKPMNWQTVCGLSFE